MPRDRSLFLNKATVLYEGGQGNSTDVVASAALTLVKQKGSGRAWLEVTALTTRLLFAVPPQI